MMTSKTKPENAGTLAVVRIRGSVKVNVNTKHTLNLMKLKSTNHCVLIPNTPWNQGTLKSVKNFVTWGEIDNETEKMLIKKRGKGKEIKPFRLSPPSKGHKPIKYLYPKGACGYRGGKINELLKRMI